MDNTQLSPKQLKQILLGIMGAFLLLMFLVAVFRSAGRGSLLETGGSLVSSVRDEIKDVVSSSSELHLQDFKRTQVKEGKLSWHIEAEDARYFASEDLAQLNHANIKVYREGGSSVDITSDAGTLYMNNQKLRNTELEGNVVFVLDGSINMFTDRATFEADKNTVLAPGKVVINGTGFWVEGHDMEFNIKTREILFSHKVKSKFVAGTKLPKSVKKYSDPSQKL